MVPRAGLASRFAKLETYVFSSKTAARGSIPVPTTIQEKRKEVLDYSTSFLFLVAGTGIEPVSRGYEPRELPLLYPAICYYYIF